MATSSLEAGSGRVEPLVGTEVAFLLLDGLRRSRPSQSTDAVLCAVGLTREGVASPLTLRVARVEDEHNWRAVLRELRADGVGPDLLLICSDGHPALVKAMQAIFPETPQQISVAHRLLALARRVEPRWRPACLAEARQIFAAPDRATAVALFRDWHARWLKQGEFAVRSLEGDLASCLTFYRFPAPLWNRIRTVNLVERLFRDARRSPLPAPSPATWEDTAETADAGEATAAQPEAVPDAPVSAAPVEVPTGPEEHPPTRAPADQAFPVLHIRPVRDAEATMLYIPPEWIAEVPAAPEHRAPVGPTARTAVVSGEPSQQERAAPSATRSAPRARMDRSGEPASEDRRRSNRRRSLRLKVALTLTSIAGLVTGIAIALGR